MYQKRNFGIMAPTFGGLLEDMFHNQWSRINEENTALSVPVNISENEKSYELELVAPGIKKEEFKISVDKNILTIAYEHKEENKEAQEGKWLRTEYRVRSFKRSFTLNEKIDASAIGAKYNDGMLFVSLPKKAEKEASTREISIN